MEKRLQLYPEINYIVSGLERSGTSMIMQMLDAGGIPCAYDNHGRPSDIHNPRGYFELAGGKIINRLRAGNFPMHEYRGKFIKITAYGLRLLPPGQYSIIYINRNIEEILDSQEFMSGDTLNRHRNRELLEYINDYAICTITENPQIKCLDIYHHNVINFPTSTACRICNFLDLGYDTIRSMSTVVDKNLHRNKRGRQ